MAIAGTLPSPLKLPPNRVTDAASGLRKFRVRLVPTLLVATGEDVDGIREGEVRVVAMASPAALKLTVSVLPETVPEGVSMKWGQSANATPAVRPMARNRREGYRTVSPLARASGWKPIRATSGAQPTSCRNPADAST